MSSPSLLVDPYADTLEMPTPASYGPSRQWERDQIAELLAANFQVVREIGRGGMGVVFLARDIALHRLVAIKALRYEFTSSEEHRERFRREARWTARLDRKSTRLNSSHMSISYAVFCLKKKKKKKYNS